MLELLTTGGWLIWPILLCSIASLAIVIDRFRQLRTEKVMPPGLYDRIEKLIQDKKLTNAHVSTLADQSPLGRIFSTAINNAHLRNADLKATVEDSGRHQIHEMEKYLNTLGSIAAITPLLGLLGTVVGMIKVFAAITVVGVGQPQELAEGISQALVTTATGLTVAIPSLLFYRHFKSHIQALSIDMEREVLRLFALIEHTKSNDTQAASKQTAEK
ncbi:MAG: MotA/TolQ/ExbB proton channel family protein [Proteobacteria bacterium]|nr:MotA/TolQ/ExbB proton channel family protein [Pseudomonadota bacterium]